MKEEGKKQIAAEKIYKVLWDIVEHGDEVAMSRFNSVGGRGSIPTEIRDSLKNQGVWKEIMRPSGGKGSIVYVNRDKLDLFSAPMNGGAA